jgi:cell division protein FtsI (penicillin-binding protein 3)
VAAPVFARIAEEALRHLAVPPDDPDRVLRVTAPYRPDILPVAYAPPPAAPPEADGDPGRMPDLRGRSAREAAIAAARRGLVVELRGSGRVVEQTPAPGTEIEPGLACVLTLRREGQGARAAAEPPPARPRGGRS